jgi:hypothetical protein
MTTGQTPQQDCPVTHSVNPWGRKDGDEKEKKLERHQISCFVSMVE